MKTNKLPFRGSSENKCLLNDKDIFSTFQLLLFDTRGFLIVQKKNLRF